MDTTHTYRKKSLVKMTGFMKLSWALVVFGLLLQSSGAVVKSGLKKNHELQAIEKILKSQAFNCTNGPSFWCENLSNAVGCNAVNHCIETTWKNSKKFKRYLGDCNACVNVVKQISKNISLNKKEEINYTIKSTCKNMSTIEKTHCKNQFDKIKDYIHNSRNAIDPQATCNKFRFCDKKHMNYQPSKNEKEASNIEDGILFFGKTYTRNARKPEQLSIIDNTELMNKLSLPIDKCPVCHAMFDKITEKMREAKFKEMIQNYTQEICKDVNPLPLFQMACKTYLDEYFKALILYAHNAMNSSKICRVFNISPEKGQSLISNNAIGSTVETYVLHIIDVFSRNNMKRLFSDMELRVRENSSYFCEICNPTMEYLQNKIIHESSTDGYIEDVLYKFCHALPGGLDDKCKNFIQKNFQAILKIIFRATDPNLVCNSCDKVNGTKLYGLNDLRNMLK